ncbi:helix-turn-helix domain-containing protein [Undibacterium cyanobacteriorum]|uniref:Helix-turn-helix domain-containing protein n=1 Tax=Undibacterium cyanobacteriorum TaxID=3073561 RepID=A0ABY9RF49_9BURK|nr:helix-turn-helix domain-containing protein [Undibacterium sp. 20NA77.5]WMW79275.1 helix-turn-helix domain-containing protein [Undibacterium sp. 20NA77.5]
MKPQIIYFLLLPDLLLVDLAGPADAFLFANRISKKKLFELRYICAQPELESSLGLTLTSTLPLPSNIESDAWIVIPGTLCQTFDPTSSAARTSIQWLREQKHVNKLICICAGALIAAHAGHLQHKHATTHHSHLAELKAIDPSIQVDQHRIFVEDGALATSAGVTAGIDLCLHLISACHTPSLAVEVAQAMLIYFRRGSNDPQLSPWLMYRNHMHTAVHRAQDLLSRDPAYPWHLEELASKLGTSSRHLSRLFKEHTSISVIDYLNQLRVQLADQFLANTSWSIERVAEAAGFGSTRQFRRVWQAKHQTSPSRFQRNLVQHDDKH